MGTYTPTGFINPNTAGYPGVGGYGVPNQGMAINGPVDIMVPKADPRMAHMPRPPVYIKPRTTQGVPPSVLQPNPSVAGVNYASSIPMSPMAPLADIPPPHLVAPHLFNPRPYYPPMNRPAPQPYPYTPMPNPYYPPAPQQPSIPGANPLNREEQKVPAQKPPLPPEAPQPPQEQPVLPPEKPLPAGLASLDNSTITMLNERLNSANEDVRSQGAMEFYKIMEANPDLSRSTSPYRNIVNAFMVKILRDPNAVVRQPGMLAFEMGYFYTPTAEVIQKLKDLTRGSGLHHLEPQTAKSILAGIASGKYEPPVRYTGGEAPSSRGNTPNAQGVGERTRRRAESMTGGSMFDTSSPGNDFGPKSDSNGGSSGANLDITSPQTI